MSDRDHALALLRMAAKDLTALSAMSDPAAFADEVFGFHAQQAVEKALKAWLSSLGLEYPRSHSIARLLALLEDAGQSVGRFRSLIEFNDFAVEYRYEEAIEQGEPLDRSTIVAEVRELYDTVCAIV